MRRVKVRRILFYIIKVVNMENYPCEPTIVLVNALYIMSIKN